MMASSIETQYGAESGQRNRAVLGNVTRAASWRSSGSARRIRVQHAGAARRNLGPDGTGPEGEEEEKDCAGSVADKVARGLGR
jgi:hypothetical protein